MKLTLIVGLTFVLGSCLGQNQQNGLQIRTLDGPTDCRRKVKAGDNIVVHYHGTLTDGEVFDSSYERQQPFNVQIGVGKVIKGWDQGIVGMCPGEKRQLVIPPELGYGARGTSSGSIPGGATLVFQVEMISFQNPEPAEAPRQRQQSGLQIRTLSGPTNCGRNKVQSGDKIVVHYHGTLTDGTVFDSSVRRNEPFNVQIGVGKVIKGWDQGIVGMCPREKRQLVIPPELGYGANGAGDVIPGGATLVFEVEMIAFQNPAAANPAPQTQPPRQRAPQQQQSGLQIRTLDGPTNCRRKVQPGDNISVHYHGTLTDGTVFDSSYQRNQPFNVQIGVGNVIQGWDQGIIGMCPTEKRQLVIPPELGYGQTGAGDDIPGGATLVFQVELVAFQ